MRLKPKIDEQYSASKVRLWVTSSLHGERDGKPAEQGGEGNQRKNNLRVFTKKSSAGVLGRRERKSVRRGIEKRAGLQSKKFLAGE